MSGDAMMRCALPAGDKQGLVGRAEGITMTTQETLLRLMSLPPSTFAGVIRTSDGFYIAQAKGDLGYNEFLGRPAPIHEGPGRSLMLKVWGGLTSDEQRAVYALAAKPMDGSPIRLHEDFGVPTIVQEVKA